MKKTQYLLHANITSFTVLLQKNPNLHIYFSRMCLRMVCVLAWVYCQGLCVAVWEATAVGSY